MLPSAAPRHDAARGGARLLLVRVTSLVLTVVLVATSTAYGWRRASRAAVNLGMRTFTTGPIVPKLVVGNTTCFGCTRKYWMPFLVRTSGIWHNGKWKRMYGCSRAADPLLYTTPAANYTPELRRKAALSKRNFHVSWSGGCNFGYDYVNITFAARDNQSDVLWQESFIPSWARAYPAGESTTRGGHFAGSSASRFETGLNKYGVKGFAGMCSNEYKRYYKLTVTAKCLPGHAQELANVINDGNQTFSSSVVGYYDNCYPREKEDKCPKTSSYTPTAPTGEPTASPSARPTVSPTPAPTSPTRAPTEDPWLST